MITIEFQRECADDLAREIAELKEEELRKRKLLFVDYEPDEDAADRWIACHVQRGMRGAR